MIPSIANYFGVTIDELFGYQNDRERKIQTIIDMADKEIQTIGNLLEGQIALTFSLLDQRVNFRPSAFVISVIIAVHQ